MNLTRRDVIVGLLSASPVLAFGLPPQHAGLSIAGPRLDRDIVPQFGWVPYNNQGTLHVLAGTGCTTVVNHIILDHLDRGLRVVYASDRSVPPCLSNQTKVIGHHATGVSIHLSGRVDTVVVDNLSPMISPYSLRKLAQANGCMVINVLRVHRVSHCLFDLCSDLKHVRLAETFTAVSSHGDSDYVTLRQLKNRRVTGGYPQSQISQATVYICMERHCKNG